MLACFLLSSLLANAQPIKIDENEPAKKFSPISLVFNRIFSISGLDSFYQKLYKLKKTKKGIVSIVHIGDSHIQSDHLPGMVRKGLQNFFGDAGKGAVFPHDLSLVFPGINIRHNESKDDNHGVIYHTIGVNGARFESFNKSIYFWEQFPAMKADLVIISLGTNDAQGEFNETDFHQQITILLDKIKKASPGAAILFTTAADSFKGGYPNRELWSMNISLFTYCTGNSIPVWDLYRITNGYGSAYNWIKKGMMDADGIHYTAKAYEVQGQLLFNAIAGGYNSYISSY